MNILGLERLVYGVDDLDACIKFHTDWGLSLRDRDNTGAVFALRDGTEVHLRPHDDPALPDIDFDWLHFSPTSTVRETIWGVESSETLAEIAAEISTDRVITQSPDGVLHTRDDFEYPIGFAVSKRKPLEIAPPTVNGVGVATRRDVPANGATRRKVMPCRFSHIVYWAPGDVWAAMDFYIKRLGFRVTDFMGQRGGFMQAQGSTDHHNLYFIHKGTFRGFQHVSYEVESIDDVVMLGRHMEKEGWTSNVGPLRHNVSSSFSWYLWNPAGGLSEVLADMDHAGSDWTVRTIDPTSADFYGHSWVARAEEEGVIPGQWNGRRGAPPNLNQ